LGAKFDFRARRLAVDVAVNINGAKQSDTCITMPIAVANTAISEPVGGTPSHCCPEKSNILSHLAKHKGLGIAIVLAIVGVK